MMIKSIPLTVQPGLKAKAQPYKGPQIVELLDIQVIADKPTMICLCDESREEKCDQFVLCLNQGIDPSCKSPGGDPIDQGNAPVVLKAQDGSMAFKTSRGYVVVMSYCFA